MNQEPCMEEFIVHPVSRPEARPERPVGRNAASGRVIAEDRATDDGPAMVLHVEDTISPALAGHEGVVYESPPLPRVEALALVRLLIGWACPTAERDSWRCPIAGGQRTITLEPLPELDEPERLHRTE